MTATEVTVRLAKPAASGTDAGVAGAMECTPFRRRTEDTPSRVVLPVAYSVPLVVDPEDPAWVSCTLWLEPTGVDWCWVLVERTYRGATRHVQVPVSATAVDYAALVDVDPLTLAPAASAVPAWTAAVDAVQAIADGVTVDAAAADADAATASAGAADAVVAQGLAEDARDAAQAAQGLAEDAAEVASAAALLAPPTGRVNSQARTDGTDQTAILQAEINALMAAGGGTLLLPEGTITLYGTLTLVNDGATPPKQAPLRMIGQGAHWSGRGTAVVGGTILDIKGSDTYGKIKTNGLGLLSLEALTIRDTSGGSTPMLYTTNTTLHVCECAFVGSKTGTLCDQDAIILGGPNQTEGGAGWTDGFQGYGTSISESFFHGIRRGVVGQAFANAVQISKLTAWTTCGNTAGGFIEWNGRPAGGGQYAAGGTIADCLIEMSGYQYGIILSGTIGMEIRGNSFYDFGASSLGAVLLQSSATGNRVTNGASVSGTKPAIVDLGNNTVLPIESGIASVWSTPQVHTSPVMQVVSGGASPGGIGSDAAQAFLLSTSGRARIATRPAVTVADGVTTSGSNIVTSATAAFTVVDVGAVLAGTGIPIRSRIAAVTNSTTVVLSAAATATATGVTFSISRVSAATVEQVSFSRNHWQALGSAPTTAVGAGAGTSATAVVSGTDVAGRVSITTGTGTAAGALGSWTPNLGWLATARVQVTPRNAATAALMADGYWISGTSALTLHTVATPAVSTLYEFDYLVIEAG